MAGVHFQEMSTKGGVSVCPSKTDRWVDEYIYNAVGHILWIYFLFFPGSGSGFEI